MIDLVVRNARLEDRTGLVDLHIDGGHFVAVAPADGRTGDAPEARSSIDAEGTLVPRPMSNRTYTSTPSSPQASPAGTRAAHCGKHRLLVRTQAHADP